MTKTKKKKIIEIKLNSWNKATRAERNKAILWLLSLLGDMERGVNFSDDFWGNY